VVMCAEGPNPRYPGVFRALAALAYARAGDVGPYWAWLDEPCASWPATAVARYAGPWDRPTAHLILVIGNSFDPSTIYEGAVALANALARAGTRPPCLSGYFEKRRGTRGDWRHSGLCPAGPQRRQVSRYLANTRRKAMSCE
jgi:TAP-like protein